MSYFADFFIRMKRRSNYPVLIYMLLNSYIVGEVLGVLLSVPFWKAYIIGLILYGVSLMLALSPVGEWFLRWQTGCKKIKSKDIINRLEPLFNEVYEKARKKDPSILTDVQLYMNNELQPNAFATGRKTVCVTEGLLALDDNQIKGILGHEFGHLAHKDTDKLLLICVGNIFFNIIVFFINLIITLISIAMHVVFFKGSRVGAWIIRGLQAITIGLMLKIWYLIGDWLILKTSRNNEYEADEFSMELKYDEGLCSGLESIERMLYSGNTPAHGLFSILWADHPDTRDRIKRLQSLGSEYKSELNFNNV